MEAVLLTLLGAAGLLRAEGHTLRRLRNAGWSFPVFSWMLVAGVSVWLAAGTPGGLVPIVSASLQVILMLLAGVLFTLAWWRARNGPEPVIDPETPNPWALAPVPDWVRGMSALLGILGALGWPTAIRESWIDALLLLLFPLVFGYLCIYGRVPRFMLSRV